MIDPVCRAWLRDTCTRAAAESQNRVERGGGYGVGQSEGGQRRIGEIDMELVQGQCILRRSIGAVVIHRAKIVFGAARRRKRHAIQIGRQQPVANIVWHTAWWHQKRNHLWGGIAGDHLCTIQRVRPDSHECGPAGELARADVVGIRPDAVFRIIWKICPGRSGHKSITKIGARGIGTGRNRNTV